MRQSKYTTAPVATKKSKYITAPVATKKMPRGIPYIIGNEAAERFSFYGMKGILVIFMTTYLFLMPGSPLDEQMSPTDATAWYHVFVSSVYFTPLLGAFIADLFLGKYLTIMLLSMVYVAGHGVLALMGTELPFMDEPLNPSFFLVLGLVLISLGAGGIKPCVSAHVGDQFGETNAHLLGKIYGLFYISINLGAAISNLLTPWLLKWYGPHWAFGVPGVLMAIATFMFWLGRKKFIHVPAGGMDFLREVFSRRGLSAIGKLAVIYVFVAMFWALFDQSGSSWILQAEDMNRTWLGITWLPSQIQLINPVMILILVPIFGFIVYPAIDKVWKLTPLRKISIGLFIMGGGFAIIAIAQNMIDQGQTPTIGWQVLAYAIVTSAEVMVSITCLEFSYTQAPRKMKSVIMSIFFFSVTLGNVITAGVNFIIQVPEETEVADAARDRVGMWRDMHDEALPDDKTGNELIASLGTADLVPRYERTEDGFQIDLPARDGSVGFFTGGSLFYEDDGTLVRTEVEASKQLEEAAQIIEVSWEQEGKLPRQADGEALISKIKDPWGQALIYHLVNRKIYYVASPGADGDLLTPLAIVLRCELQEPPKPEDEGTWLSRQRKARQQTDSSANAAKEGESDELGFSRSFQIGGQLRLEGAAYFWFFTWLMLGTAVVFVPVAWLYKPQTYLHEEGATEPGT